MRLFDRTAQCIEPFNIERISSGATHRVEGPAEFAAAAASCPVRYVLSDDLVRVCAQLAYSKGLGPSGCLDLLNVPAESVWMEWAHIPFRESLTGLGISGSEDAFPQNGHRGVLIESCRSGRHGRILSFWDVDGDERDALLSPVAAHFDLDGWDSRNVAGPAHGLHTLSGSIGQSPEEITDCLRVAFLPQWERYYESACRTSEEKALALRAGVGTILHAIPVVFSFLLLLGVRSGIGQTPMSMQRLNKRRARDGKRPLLDYVEVRSPLLPIEPACTMAGVEGRRGPRLHHVRGHLVRRGSELHWRMPHWRGSLSRGRAAPRTVTWSVSEYPWKLALLSLDVRSGVQRPARFDDAGTHGRSSGRSQRARQTMG